MSSASSPLTSAQIHLIEELVAWRAKVKDIRWVVRSPATEGFARKLYAHQGVRPPNGVAGSATSRCLTPVERKTYVSLAVAYTQALELGVPRGEAMLATFRVHWREAPGRVNASVWMALTRDLDCHNTELVCCGACGGQHIVERAARRGGHRCIWCGGVMPAHRFTPQGAPWCRAA